METNRPSPEPHASHILDQLPIAVFILDGAGRPHYSNRRAIELLGKGVDPSARPEDLAAVYQAFVAGTETPYPTQRMPIVRALGGENGVRIDDIEIRRPEGRIPLEVWATPIVGSDGAVEYAVAAFTDISERRRMEAKVHKAHEEQRRLEASRVQLFNNVAHELASPLTTVGIQLRLLERALGGVGGPAAKSTEILSRKFQHLVRLVEDFKDVARMESGQLKIRLQSVDLAVILRATYESFRPVLEDRQIDSEIEVPDALPAEVDPGRIGQVVQNLLSNASKFTPPHGRVRLRATRTEEGALVSVEDTGRGLAPAEIGQLFQPFVQVHDPSETQQKGTGLGLYICKGLIEGHGGRIWAESQGLGGGSRFAFSLPSPERGRTHSG